MLKVKEIAASLKFARAVGERHHGMFDHNANAVSGPQDWASGARRDSSRADETGEADSTDSQKVCVRYEQYLDEKTEEPLFRLVED